MRLKLIAIALGCGMTSGCHSELKLIPVHGRVLYLGQPLEYGSVMFQPEGAGPLARGTIESGGTFVLSTQSEGDGVRPGKCRVRITAFEAQKSGQRVDRQREMSLGKSAIPRKYLSFGTSGLVVEITPEMELPLVIELE